jgi:Fur family peroxide stress response transcriptional regulator
MKKTQKQAKNILSKHNINTSYYRIVILEYLIKTDKCLTVDEVFKKIYASTPTLSKATVYNNLSIFENHDIVDKILFEQDDVRYCLKRGKNTVFFKCLSCSSILRIQGNSELFENKMIENNKIEKVNITAYGICKTCLGKKEEK